MAQQCRMNFVSYSQLDKWDKRFLNLAAHVAQWSKGPRKRVGAVIAKSDKSIVSVGYNGPPAGYDDEAFLQMSREDQHKIVQHAEANALVRAGVPLGDCTLYVVPMFPCVGCAQLIVAASIRRVVALCGQMQPDWQASAEQAKELFKRNNVEFIFAEL